MMRRIRLNIRKSVWAVTRCLTLASNRGSWLTLEWRVAVWYVLNISLAGEILPSLVSTVDESAADRNCHDDDRSAQQRDDGCPAFDDSAAARRSRARKRQLPPLPT